MACDSDSGEGLGRTSNPITDPESYFGKYFCPDEELCHKFISLTLGRGNEFKYAGLPIYIRDASYVRGCFRFCLVLCSSYLSVKQLNSLCFLMS